MYMITRESIYYINLRQAYLLSPYYASRLSSRTVLFTSVPDEYLDEGNLRRMLGEHVRRVWIATDTSDLDDEVKNRDKIAMKLEAAETKLIKLANASRLKSEKKGARPSSEDAAIAEHGEPGSVASRYIKPKQRPTHRLRPLVGKKVDTIDWCRAELQKIIPKVDGMQERHRSYDVKKLNSVFVEFDTLTEAQAAYQSLTHHQVLHMAPRFTGVMPSEVIWSNLRIKWWERVIRVLLTTSFVVALIIFWSIPVAIVGSISNINYLIGIKGLQWLSFIHKLPTQILGVITGLLPTILLAALMAVLPIILRLTARLSGDPSLSAVELTVQNYYFGFQVVQVFLVATLGSAASSAVGTILKNPTGIPTLLASQIPLASNFYLSYFILQGLGVVSSILLGLVGLVIFIVLGKLLDKTPRKMYKRWITLSYLGWGTVFPVYTNLFVIAICYAVIAPLVLGFAAIGLYFFYVAYRYNLLFVSNANVDTKGLVYPRALQQIFVGLYVAEFCLIGLFAIATASSIGALGPLILMIILLIFTALYQVSLNSALDPLLKYLPKSLDAEERRLYEIERGEMTSANHDDGAGMKEAHQATMSQSTRHNHDLEPAPHKKPNMITKFLRPDIYTDYATMRRLVPKEIEIRYEPETERDAYFNPSIKSQTPLLWIPRDPMGISAQEVRDTRKVIPITDEGATFDNKGNIVWDAENGRPPIWEKPVYY
ncbi:phosphate metabolism protein 7 [Elasticomyces elasticus]|nr:phosphate metabolism protein 7 [Elasticomyces elasticus]